MTPPRDKLKQLRNNNKLLQSDIAEILEISTSFYSAIETGARNPTINLAKKIADLFEVSIEELFFNNKSHNTSNKVDLKQDS